MVPQILYIDLSASTSELRYREDLSKYLGGTGFATAIFLEEVESAGSPCDSGQPIVIAAGFLAPYFPTATKSVAVFYSPLSGYLGESHAGGRLALAMKLAGVDAVVIKGRSPHPLYLSVMDHTVSFNNAEPLWGLKATETATYIREKEKNAGMRSVVRIGTAGEKAVAYSMAVVDTYRHFGRLGLGAVMGAKNLKALVISGSGEKASGLESNSGYKALYEDLFTKTISGSMRKYHEYGTAMNILPLNEMKSLPVENLRRCSIEQADNISGESFAHYNLSRKFACAGCPLGCIHIATVRKQFGPEEEWERTDVCYDYELVYALGSLLGITDRDSVLELIEKVEELGIDAIYAGVMLAWVTEAVEKRLIDPGDTGVSNIGFGTLTCYLELLDNLVSRKDEFYELMRKGIPALTKRYGGSDFALLAGNNAIAGYHTGYANLIGQHLVGVRNSHTDNAGYSIDQENTVLSPEEMVDKLLEEEIFRSFFNCTGICLFARKIYDTKTIKNAAAALGMDLGNLNERELGEEIYLRKMRFKIDRGFDPENYIFPRRFSETAAAGKNLDREYINKAKQYFAVKLKTMMAAEAGR